MTTLLTTLQQSSFEGRLNAVLQSRNADGPAGQQLNSTRGCLKNPIHTGASKHMETLKAACSDHLGFWPTST